MQHCKGTDFRQQTPYKGVKRNFTSPSHPSILHTAPACRSDFLNILRPVLTDLETVLVPGEYRHGLVLRVAPSLEVQ